MAIATPSSLIESEPPELHSGDRMTQEEFHRIYSRMPKNFKAELVAGTVYVASPLKRRHGTNHLPLGSLFFLYETATPGVEAGDNATIKLGGRSEPQPDLYLRILTEFGGQTRISRDDYILGAPELLAEIAHSSQAIELRDDYARNHVLEYLIVCLKERQLRWFHLKANQELRPDADGVYRIRDVSRFLDPPRGPSDQGSSASNQHAPSRLRQSRTCTVRQTTCRGSAPPKPEPQALIGSFACLFFHFVEQVTWNFIASHSSI